MKRILIIAIGLTVLALLCGCQTIKELVQLFDNVQDDPSLEHAEINYGNEGDETDLLVVTGPDGKYGYIDTKGNVVIEPVYLGAKPFSDGLAAVKRGFFWGYIDKTGKTVLDFQYDYAAQAVDGRMVVGKSQRVNGRPPVRVTTGEFALIDRSGNILLPFDNRRLILMLDGRIQYADKKGSKGFYDRNFRTVMEPIKCSSGEIRFQEGLAAVENNENLYGYLDVTGKWAIAPQYREAFGFSEGVAVVMLDDVSMTYINKAGEDAFPLNNPVQWAGSFHEGVACVLDYKDSLYCIDLAGKKLFDIKGADGAAYFSDGLCEVMKQKPGGPDGQMVHGFADRTGTVVIDYLFDDTSPFINGIAQVLVDDKIGYIDKTGKYIWEPQ